MERPIIHIISLGGTIAMTPATTGGVTPTLTAEDLVAGVPGLDDVAQFYTHAFKNVASANLGLSDIVELRDFIVHLLKEGDDGVVVTQGTDTMEETAYALDLLLDVPQPVVFTGAMRNPSAAGADGPANLLGAVTVACSDVFQDCGVMVVMADQIHAAQSVTKTHSSHLGAFVSPDAGPMGSITEGRITCYSYPKATYKFNVKIDTPLPKVALYMSRIGDDGGLFDLVKDSGYDGMVISAMGGGHLSEEISDKAVALASSMPVVFASRCGAGAVLTDTYGYKGGEIDLVNRGLIPAGKYHPLKARILLTFALALGHGVEQISYSLNS